MPAPEYRQATSEAELWCFRNIPFYARWYRFFLYRARALHGLLPFLYGDEAWQGRPDAVGRANDEMREAMTEYIREQTGDGPLFQQLVPDYPPGGKRPVLDDGTWISTLLRDNVELVTTGIERIVSEGVVTRDGRRHDVDVLIYGTGFHANEFLFDMEIVGRISELPFPTFPIFSVCTGPTPISWWAPASSSSANARCATSWGA